MTTASFVARIARLAPLLLLLLHFAPLEAAYGQKKKEKLDEDFENFKELCPYTKGELELERKLGYVRVGLIPWRGTSDSQVVRENCGGVPMIFVETEHFRIGSSLLSYRIPNDKEERARLKAEIGRLADKLGKLKAPKREIDPWLRLHLVAQRAEEQYQQFLDDWGIAPETFAKEGANLGFPDKYLLLVCQRKSEFGRYIKIYENSDLEYSYRTGWFGEGMITAGNFEAIAEHWKDEKDMPLDSMFTCMITASIGANFIDGWNGNMFRAPAWLTYGYVHLAQKRFDPRWPVYDGRTNIYGKDRDKTEWQPRVSNLVKNDFFASTDKMFEWSKYDDMNQRDHLIAWSRLDFLLNECEGNGAAFLTAICPTSSGISAEPVEVRKERQVKALAEHFALTPTELDEAWAKWVKKTYAKK